MAFAMALAVAIPICALAQANQPAADATAKAPTVGENPARGGEPAAAPQTDVAPTTDTAATETTSTAAEPEAPKGVPVHLEEKTLFRVATRVGSFSPEERALRIQQRIHDLATEPLASETVVTTEETENATDVVAEGRVIVSVTDGDAEAAGKPRAELAKEIAAAIEASVRESRTRLSLQSIAIDVALALLATILMVALIRLAVKFFAFLLLKIESWRGTIIRPLRIQRLELLSAERATNITLGVAELVRNLVFVLLVLAWVGSVLSVFPWTRGYTAKLITWLLTPLGSLWTTFVDYLPNLFFLLVIGVVTYYGLRLVRLIFVEIERGHVVIPGFDDDWAIPTYKIVRFLVLAFAAIISFPYLPGADSPAFKGVSIFLGVLFSLGSSSAIAHIVSGVVLTYTRAFRIGDRVKIADTVGDVVEKNLLVTRIRTIKNVDVTIPNAMVLGSHIINFSASAQNDGLILNTSVTIGYDVPWKQVHALLIDAAERTDGIIDEPRPFVFQTSLDDFYVAYEINAYTDQPNRMARLYSDLHQNIQDAFNEAGVEIMSPHYGALRDGNEIAIPAESRRPGYRAPSFRVKTNPEDA